MAETKVLFLCTGNSARSQMAEALLRKLAGDRFEVHSAGLDPKGIHPLARRAMEEVGISLDRHSSKDVREYLGKTAFRYVITLCSNAEQRCPRVFLGTPEVMHWPFDDPAAATGTEEERLCSFRLVRDAIGKRLREWLDEAGGSSVQRV